MKQKLTELVNCALDKLYREDKYLINMAPKHCYSDEGFHLGERAIMFRFAHYLANLMEEEPVFRGYNLDCEYNRNLFDIKKMPSTEANIMPDIIIHKRGENKHNLLVVEVKTYWNNDAKYDKEKIKEFVDQSGCYKYRYGTSLIIEKNRADVDLKLYGGQQEGMP